MSTSESPTPSEEPVSASSDDLPVEPDGELSGEMSGGLAGELAGELSTPTRAFADAIPGALPDDEPALAPELLATAGALAGAASLAGSASLEGSGRSGEKVASRGGARAPIRRPGWGFLLSHPAHWIALGFGSGLPWVMPGTFGTLFGWMAFVACMPHFTDAYWAFAICTGFLVGIWACGVTGRNLGVSDHGSIVWDEIVAIWLVLWLVPQTVADQVAAFVIFRAIDIIKPQPIRYFDAKWKNGFGVMFDDLLAAFFTLLLFAVYYRFVGLPT